MATDDAIDELTKALSGILEQCDAASMVPPFVLTVASANGSGAILRVRGDGSPPETLAEHFEPSGFTMPLVVTLIDQHASSAKFTITPGEPVQH